MDFPINLKISDLRPLELNPKGIARSLVENMYGSVESGVLDADQLSQTDGPLPVYEGSRSFGVNVGNVFLQSSPTANRNHVFQNKDGVVALLDDVYGISGTVVVPEGLVSVDWTLGKDFLCVLSGNRQSTFYMFHSHAGMEIDLLLVNNGTSQTVHTWDPLIKWPGGTATAMPASEAGAASMLKVNLVNVNGVIYGEPTAYAVTAPVL